MTYVGQRDSFSRTPQELIVVGVRECQNHYASLVQQGLLRTEEIDHATWTQTDIASIVANDQVAPDAEDTLTKTAEKVTPSAIGGFVQQEWDTGAGVADKSYMLSFFAKIGTDHTLNTAIRPGANPGGATKSFVHTVAAGWVRFFFQLTFGSGVLGNIVRVRIAPDIAATNHFAWIWGVNLHRIPNDNDFEVQFPYTRRSNEVIGIVSTNVSRCQAPDQGDGNRCFYSRPTCQDFDGFNAGNIYEASPRLVGIREFRFCMQGSALPIPSENIAPLLKDVRTATQRIKPDKAVTENERITFSFEDDSSPSAWNPRQSQEGGPVNTAKGNGTFWRRFSFIYHNYDNPECYVDRKVGFVEAGATESDFQDRGRYLIQRLSFQDRKIRLTCGDRLKLTIKEVPPEIDDNNRLGISGGAAITLGQTVIEVTNAGQITPLALNSSDPSPDYIVTLESEPDTGNSEKMNVTAIDLDSSPQTVTVARGRWGTTAKTHPGGSAFREIVEFGTERLAPSGVPLGKNPIDIVIELYRRAGAANDEIDKTTLQAERDTWFPSTIDTALGTQLGTTFRRTLTEKTKIEDLVKEIRDLMILLLWTTDDQKITGKFYAPPLPTDTITEFTDDSNYVAGSISVEDDLEERLSRVVVAYDLPAGSDGEKPSDFNEVRVSIDIDAEEREFYGKDRLKTILSLWIRPGDTQFAGYFAQHLLARFRHGTRSIMSKHEIKDDDIDLGDVGRTTTQMVQDAFGNTKSSLGIVVKKKPLARQKQIQLEVLDQGLLNSTGFWTDSGFPDFGTATDDQKRRGFWTDTRGFLGSPKELGYHWW